VIVKAGGNVGIGIDPTTKLDVNGAANVRGKVTAQTLAVTTLPGSGKVLTSDASGNATWQSIPIQTATGTAGGDLTGTYPTPTIRVRSGLVGLGSVTAPAYRLELPNTGNSAGQGRANAWVTYSSGRWKHNVAPIGDPLGKIMALNGVMFDWNVENGGGHDIGFVAEDVGKVVPELVAWELDGSGYAQGMKYDRVTALTVEAIKAQQK